jgi:tetratricopeptide (TPR) repeat protein/class 3 adenylate cyclase
MMPWWVRLVEKLGRRSEADAAERWRQVQHVFASALELPADERSRFLEEACAGAPELRREAESLLAAHGSSGVLDRPVLDLLSPGADAARAPRPGAIVGRYEILEDLGAGGMGVVYRARDVQLERTVALKFLPPHLSSDTSARDRFLVEAQAAAALDHPNICTILEIGATEQGQLFIAMPFYDGETLAPRIARGPLPAQEALGCATQVARGLARAHEHGIIHRDIKPANLIVTADGTVKILDFGIAKLADVSLTRPGARPGTVAYMSPEQAAGEAIDHRTDVWSLGVVFYEMLAGQRPFRGTGDRVVLNAIRHHEPEPIARLRPGLAPGISSLLAQALAKRPAARYPTMQEMAATLEELCLIGAEPSHGAVAVPRVLPSRPLRAANGMGGDVLPEGERRKASVLVATLSGYVELVERLAPAELEAVIRRFRQLADEIAERHGGVVNHCTGDEAVLLFGIPVSHEDDSHRAIRAALELRGRVRELGAELERATGQAVHLHIGIDVGAVVAQPADGQGYRIAGTVALMAAQLSAHAAADEVWVGPQVRRVVEPFFETEAREPIAVRDREHPLRPFHIVRESGLENRLELAGAGLTPHTGRDAELAILRNCLHSVVGGEGQFVSVLGDAGLGKSRLLYEFRRELDERSLEIVQARCQAHGGGTAYLPFIEALRRLLRLAGGEATPARTEAAVGRIRTIAAELEEFIPLYLHLLSLPTDNYPLPKHLHGDQFRIATQEALAGLLTLMARHRPAVILLEDWHWADEASHGVLQQLADMVPAHALLLVVTYRPGYGIDWGEATQHTPILLRPLEIRGSAEMLKLILRVQTVPQELNALLHERTGGNPFFLEEICQALLEEGAIQVGEGDAVLTSAVHALDLPDSVQAVIRARMDRLDRNAREILRVAAVCGRDFTRSTLERCLPGTAQLSTALDTLKTAGLVQQTRVVPDPCFRFKHVLTQEVAYSSLLEHQRRDLHGRVGKAIEAQASGRRDDHLELLAHHFSRAEEWSPAIEYGLWAAERANLLAQYPHALHLLERTQRWLANLASEEERRKTLIEILLRQERLCETLGLRGRQQQIIDDLITFLEPTGDRERLGEVYVRQGDLYTLLRQYDQAEAALLRSLQIRRELGDELGERNSLRSLGLLRWHQDRNAEALELIEEALDIGRRRDDREAILGDLSNLGQILKSMGEYERARDMLEEALRMVDASLEGGSGTPSENLYSFKEQFVLHILANVHRELGDEERALHYLRRARDNAVARRLPIQASFHHSAIAHIYLQQGRIEESLRHYHEAVEMTRKSRYASGLSQMLRMLGEVLLGLDRPTEALPHLEEAAQIFAQLRDQQTEALMWRRIGAVREAAQEYADALAAWSRARNLHAQRGETRAEIEALEAIGRVTRRLVAEPSLALGHYREALARAEALGEQPAAGRLHNTIGILEWNRGDYLAALSHYERALAIFRELEDAAHTGLMLNSIGVTLHALGRIEEAGGWLSEAIAHHSREALRQLEGHALAALGELEESLDELSTAAGLYERSLAIRREIGDRRGEAWMLHHLAQVAIARGTLAEADEYIAAAAQAANDCDDEQLVQACARLRRSRDL